jgi:hypothetical protein
MKSMKWMGGVAVLLMAGGAQAQLPACQNSCGSPDVAAPHQGRHSASDTSADGVVWPPNHKFRTMKLSGSTNSNGKECDINITAVKQDEAPNGLGSGGPKHCPDAQGINNTSSNSTQVDLRGERSGTQGEDETQGGMGTGRYYHVQYDLVDPDCTGSPKSDEALLLVPHDQGVAHADMWVDEGALYDSQSCTF